MKKIVLLFASMVLLVTSCSKNEPVSEPSIDAPKFLYSTPANKAKDVLLGTEVSVVYNVDIKVAENSGITVNNQTVNVTVSGKKLILNFDIQKNMDYQITIPEGAIQNMDNVSATAVSFSFSSVSDSGRYEAEDATLSGGATIAKSLSGFSGTGYVDQQDGNITFKVLIPEAGKYKVNIRYASVNGDKVNNLEVNGQNIASVSFTESQTWLTTSVNKVPFNAGENTVAIVKNWGWIYVDYIEISEADEDVPFNIEDTLVTSHPSAEAVKLYDFLKNNFGKKIISGAMANYSTGIEEAQWMYDNIGKWPALTGFDMINYTTTWGKGSYADMKTNVENWWNNNGLVAIMWHWRDPLKDSEAFYTKDTSFDISKIDDTSSDEYKAMLADIDSISLYLKQFRDANIPIIWRPLHEASGGWFWWGAKGAEPCKALWKLMFDRMVNYHHLNNLIWVWTSQGNDSTWYPGDQYVDIIGMDIYPGENQHESQYAAFSKVKEMSAGKKIITLSECGSMPTIDAMFEYGDTWSWFMPWNGDYTTSDSYNGTNFLKSVMDNDKVITRDQMPSLK